MIDRVARQIDRNVVEVPVGFKWLVDGLVDGSLGFGGEESAGASFLTRKGLPWSTDKDGIILNLLAAEMTAITGQNPSERYHDLTKLHGSPAYTLIDAAATREQKEVLSTMSPESVKADTLAGEAIQPGIEPGARCGIGFW